MNILNNIAYLTYKGLEVVKNAKLCDESKIKGIKLENLSVGDHIFIERFCKDFTFGYTHHGIIMSLNPIIVAHPVPNSDNRLMKCGVFKKTSIDVFIAKNDKNSNYITYIVEKAEYKCFNNDVANARAGTKFIESKLPIERILENVNSFIDNNNEYHIFSNNCETFASFCCTGKNLGCKQFQKIKDCCVENLKKINKQNKLKLDNSFMPKPLIDICEYNSNKHNINLCSKKELMKIKGIGTKTAEIIIQNRPYKTFKDLQRIKGIGKTLINKIKNSAYNI